MSRTYREAFIRVAITQHRNGLVYCLPVNKDHVAFDVSRQMPTGLCVSDEALVASPVEREIEPIQLWNNGKKYNGIERKRATA